MSPSTAARVPAEERREQVLAAAARAFARTGYAGTSTDAIAKEAGVSQPYVVRIFGTKLELFLETFQRSIGLVVDAFTRELEAAASFDPADDADWERLGRAYTTLMIRDRDALQVMMHGFAAAGVPEVGAAARHSMSRIYELILRTGCTEDQARDFYAQGMLLNVLLAMNAPEHVDDEPGMESLCQCAFGDALDLLG